jgi:hypothetical protein
MQTAKYRKLIGFARFNITRKKPVIWADGNELCVHLRTSLQTLTGNHEDSVEVGFSYNSSALKGLCQFMATPNTNYVLVTGYKLILTGPTVLHR